MGSIHKLTDQLKEEHQDQWIAYSSADFTIYSYDQDLQKLLEKLSHMNAPKDKLILHHVLPFDKSFAPAS